MQLAYNFRPTPNILTEFERKLSILEQVRYIEHPETFYKETAYNLEVDNRKTYYSLFSPLKTSLHRFTANSGYLTHGFSLYRGSFHAQMIRGLINYANLEKDATILDCFCGSGTTIIEACLLGFKAIGIDINPIAYLTTKVKFELLKTSLQTLTNNNDHFFSLEYYQKYRHSNFKRHKTLDIRELYYLFNFIWSYTDHKRFNTDIMKAFQRRYRLQISLLTQFGNLKDTLHLHLPEARVYWDNNLKKLDTINSNSVDLILTSPPYLFAIDYIEEDYTQISYLFDKDAITRLKNHSIGNTYKNKKISEQIYWIKMRSIIPKLYRVLRPQKYLIFIIGSHNNLKEKFLLLFQASNFKVIDVYERDTYNSFNTTKNIEYVLILQK